MSLIQQLKRNRELKKPIATRLTKQEFLNDLNSLNLYCTREQKFDDLFLPQLSQKTTNLYYFSFVFTYFDDN